MAGHDVFLSYSSKDKLAADAVCHGLESRNIKCWIAPRDQVAGKPYGEQITEAIQASKVMVLVFSDNVNASHAVHNEVDLAAGANVTIIPFRITSATFNPELRFYLGRVHWLDAFPLPVDNYIENLASTVKRNLETAEPEFSGEHPPDHGPGSPAPALDAEPEAVSAAPSPPPRPASPVPASTPVIQPAAKGGANQIFLILGGLFGLIVLSFFLMVFVLPRSLGLNDPPNNQQFNQYVNTARQQMNNSAVTGTNTAQVPPAQRTAQYYETLQVANGPPMTLNGGSVITTPDLARFLTQAQPGSYALVDARGCTNEPVIPNSMCIAYDDLDTLRQRVPTSAPLIIYCHDGACGLSYLLATAALQAGYTEVYWYRGGINAWMAAGGPTTRYQQEQQQQQPPQ